MGFTIVFGLISSQKINELYVRIMPFSGRQKNSMYKFNLILLYALFMKGFKWTIKKIIKSIKNNIWTID